jgi:GTP-binding protein
VLVAKNQGTAKAYSLDKLQDRGAFIIYPGEEIYSCQVIGEHIKPGDLVVNVVEGKKLTNMRASGSDDATRIAPKVQMTLEECMEYIQQDECIEVTPKAIRIRKTMLNEEDRKRYQKMLKAEEAS